MNKSLLSLTILAALALAACGDNTPTPPAASEPPSIIKQTEPPKADGTVGMMLPDFAQLVAREGGAVVNIQASRERDEDDNNGNEDPFMEFFKRLTPNAPDFSEDDNATSANFGSGFIISPDGYILTNTHVIKGMTNIKVTLNDKRQYPAKLIGQDEKSDVALLKIEAKNLPTVKIGNPDELRSGEWVAAIGAPFGFENSVTSGIVSAKNRTLPDDGYMPFIQTDVAINPGNSGGPLFNLKGQVVGINSQIYSRSGGFMGISFAIPINVAMNVADQLKATGALVAKVLAGSPAERGGLKVGDIIRSVNGNEVRSSSDLPMTISSLKPNQTVKLGVWRKGQMLDVEIKLGTQNDIAAKSERQSSDRGDNVDDFQFAAAGLTLIVNSNGNIVVSNVKGIAANAGLRRGDILLEVAGKEVHSQEEFNAAIESAGKNIPLLVQRGSSNLFMALILP